MQAHCWINVKTCSLDVTWAIAVYIEASNSLTSAYKQNKNNDYVRNCKKIG